MQNKLQITAGPSATSADHETHESSRSHLVLMVSRVTIVREEDFPNIDHALESPAALSDYFESKPNLAEILAEVPQRVNSVQNAPSIDSGFLTGVWQTTGGEKFIGYPDIYVFLPNQELRKYSGTHDPVSLEMLGVYSLDDGTNIDNSDVELIRIQFQFADTGGWQTVNRGIYRVLSDNKIQVSLGQWDRQPTFFAEKFRIWDDQIFWLERVNLPDGLEDTSDVEKMPEFARIAEPIEYFLYSKTEGQSRSIANLKQLTKAALCYHDDRGRLPKSEGKVLEYPYPYSWRVAILPYIGRKSLYQYYRFSEPWDSEHNKRILAAMPEVFRHPDQPIDSTLTSYVGIADECSALGVNKSKSIEELIDGASQTILFVESSTQIPWTKPEDLSIENETVQDFEPWESGKIMAGFADGSVQVLDRTHINERQLLELIRCDDGLPVEFPGNK